MLKINTEIELTYRQIGEQILEDIFGPSWYDPYFETFEARENGIYDSRGAKYNPSKDESNLLKAARILINYNEEHY